MEVSTNITSATPIIDSGKLLYLVVFQHDMFVQFWQLQHMLFNILQSGSQLLATREFTEIAFAYNSLKKYMLPPYLTKLALYLHDFRSEIQFVWVALRCKSHL